MRHAFAHDTSGHITRYNACSDNASTCANADDTFIDWNARGLAEKVTVGKSATDAKPTARDSLHYGPDGARYLKKSEWAVKSGNTTTMKTSRKYYAGAYEKTVTVGGDTVERIRVSDSVVHVRTTPASGTATAAFEYAHRDHLGSLEAVTDASGKTLTVLGHDPHGERRNDWSSQLTPTQIGTLLDGHGERVSRGFTGHEHLDRTGLIHMNGRIYDPRLGRFLSPDPIVGDPTSSRSWNLYSYVGNNPLSHVDPTGLFQAGPMCPVYGPAMCMAGSGAGAGGGSTARTRTVTFTVYGVAAVPYRYSVPTWTSVWDPGLDDYVRHRTYDDFWDVAHVPFSRDVTVTVAFQEQSVADQPADSADVEMSIVDKVFGAIKDGTTGIPLEDILGDALEHATEKILEKIRARGDVILSEVEFSNDQAVATGSFENTGMGEIRIPQKPGVMVLEPTMHGTFEVSSDQLKLMDLQGILGGLFRRTADPIDTITVTRQGDVQHTTRRR